MDADDRTEEDRTVLQGLGVHALPVAEVENLLLLPNVFVAIAEELHCDDPDQRLAELTRRVGALLQQHRDQVCARYAARQIDRLLKRVTVAVGEVTTLVASFQAELSRIDAASMFAARKKTINDAIAAGDLPSMLAVYDNKGLLSTAATVLDVKGPKALQGKVLRAMKRDGGERMRAELLRVVPQF